MANTITTAEVVTDETGYHYCANCRQRLDVQRTNREIRAGVVEGEWIHDRTGRVECQPDTGITARQSNCSVQELCTLCGEWDRTDYIRFLLDDEYNVCDLCAVKHARDLADAVDRLYGAGWQGIQDERVQAVLPYDEPVTVEQLEAAAEYLEERAS